MKKLGLSIGINNYPAGINDLQGCVNDCKGWSSFLQNHYGFNMKMLLNGDATVERVKKEMEIMKSAFEKGDSCVITFSCHGTSILDKNNDEEDCRDEAIVLYGGLLIDDEFRDILDSFPKGMNTTIITDCCHSATVTRAMGLVGRPPTTRKEKKCIPYDLPDGKSEIPLRKRFGVPFEAEINAFYSGKLEIDMNEILISGCLANEYSYDAQIDGKFCGAFTYYALKILKNAPITTYENFYNKLLKYLPSRQYPQTPQMEGKLENKKKLMFS